MNLFRLDDDPFIAASYNCDKHVVKIILEATQLLSTSLNVLGFWSPYKPTHTNHPMRIWCGHSVESYYWTLQHLCGLCYQYRLRYKKTHKCEQYIKLFNLHECLDKLTYKAILPFPQCMPKQYAIPNDPVTAYRNYYNNEKFSFARWSPPSITPYWFAPNEQSVEK